MNEIHHFAVPGISCDHCRVAIEQSVGAVAGVRSVEVDLDRKTVDVGGGERGAIEAAIDEAGYDVA